MKRLVTLFLGPVIAACGSSNTASHLVSTSTPTAGGAFESKCAPGKPDEKPLVVALSSSEKLAMEARLRSGPLVVKYGACDLELLSHCTTRGTYRYTGATPKRDQVSAKNADELFARIPVGAATIAGKLQTHGGIAVAMVSAGRFDIEGGGMDRGALDGSCAGATHVVTALTVGAYRMAAGADAEIAAEASLIAGAGAGARSASSRETLSEDGDGKACQTSGDGDTKPPRSCGALLRLELAALSGESKK
jgi:hypothetical protein